MGAPLRSGFDADAADYYGYGEKLKFVDEPFLVGLAGSTEGSDGCTHLDESVGVSVVEVRRSHHREEETELEEIA